MRIIITIALTLICYCSSMAQCELSQILPFEFGITKFEAVQMQHNLKLVQSEYKPYPRDGWKKIQSTKKDSIYFAEVWLYLQKSNCFKGERNDLRLHFSDDKLYKIWLEMDFKAQDFSEMKSTYNNLITSLKSSKLSREFKEIDPKTKQQTGEGFHFYTSEVEGISKRISVSYKVVYKTAPGLTGGRRVTNEPEKYELHVILLDLERTKLLVDQEF